MGVNKVTMAKRKGKRASMDAKMDKEDDKDDSLHDGISPQSDPSSSGLHDADREQEPALKPSASRVDRRARANATHATIRGSDAYVSNDMMPPAQEEDEAPEEEEPLAASSAPLDEQPEEDAGQQSPLAAHIRERVSAVQNAASGRTTAQEFDEVDSGASGSTATQNRQASDSDRRLMGAAATIGGTAGMMLLGPISGAAFGAAAAYATTREDGAGSIARRAGATYLHVADKVVDESLKVVDQALEEGQRRVSKSIQNIDPEIAPLALRKPLRRLSNALQGDDSGPAASEERLAEAQKLREQHPGRILVLCEKSPHCDLPEIQRKKFAVPGTMLCGEFKYIVHKHVSEALKGSLRAEQTIYLFINGISPKTSTPMADLHAQFGAEDGFLYVRYGAENTLG